MAFKKIERKVPRAQDASIYFYPRTSSKQTARAQLSAETLSWLGWPRAIYFEWDDDASLIRVVSSSPDDPHSYPVDKQRRIAIAGLLASLGVEDSDSIRVRVVRDGPIAVIADLSEYRSR